MVPPAADGAECRRAVALYVLSTLSPRELRTGAGAFGQGDDRPRAGVGPKLALRIVTELKDKAPAMMLRGDGEDTRTATSRRAVPKPMRSRRWSSSAIPKARPRKRWRARCAIWAMARRSTR